jgi:hypothetical protein
VIEVDAEATHLDLMHKNFLLKNILLPLLRIMIFGWISVSVLETWDEKHVLVVDHYLAFCVPPNVFFHFYEECLPANRNNHGKHRHSAVNCNWTQANFGHNIRVRVTMT